MMIMDENWPAILAALVFDRDSAPHSGQSSQLVLTPTTEMLSFFQELQEAF